MRNQQHRIISKKLDLTGHIVSMKDCLYQLALSVYNDTLLDYPIFQPVPSRQIDSYDTIMGVCINSGYIYKHGQLTKNVTLCKCLSFIFLMIILSSLILLSTMICHCIINLSCIVRNWVWTDVVELFFPAGLSILLSVLQ